jgi:hypothetical protein
MQTRLRIHRKLTVNQPIVDQNLAHAHSSFTRVYVRLLHDVVLTLRCIFTVFIRTPR